MDLPEYMVLVLVLSGFKEALRCPWKRGVILSTPLSGINEGVPMETGSDRARYSKGRGDREIYIVKKQNQKKKRKEYH